MLEVLSFGRRIGATVPTGFRSGGSSEDTIACKSESLNPVETSRHLRKTGIEKVGLVVLSLLQDSTFCIFLWRNSSARPSGRASQQPASHNYFRPGLK